MCTRKRAREYTQSSGLRTTGKIQEHGDALGISEEDAPEYSPMFVRIFYVICMHEYPAMLMHMLYIICVHKCPPEYPPMFMTIL